MRIRALPRRLALLLAAVSLACSGAADGDAFERTAPDGSTGVAPETAVDGRGASTPPARTAPSPESIGGIVAVRTDVRGVIADLLTAEREGGRLTVAVRFRNVSEDSRPVEIGDDYRARWRLIAGGRDWPLILGVDGEPAATAPPRRTLQPGQTALWRGTFVAPPEHVTTFRLEIPGVGLFEDVPITDA